MEDQVPLLRRGMRDSADVASLFAYAGALRQMAKHQLNLHRAELLVELAESLELDPVNITQPSAGRE